MATLEEAKTQADTIFDFLINEYKTKPWFRWLIENLGRAPWQGLPIPDVVPADGAEVTLTEAMLARKPSDREYTWADTPWYDSVPLVGYTMPFQLRLDNYGGRTADEDDGVVLALRAEWNGTLYECRYNYGWDTSRDTGTDTDGHYRWVAVAE